MAKRGQNEGSIFKRPDGRWCAQLNLGYINGRRTRRYFYGETRREVQMLLTKVLREQQQGLPVLMERQTVEQFFNHWIENTVKPNRAPTTYVSYKQYFTNHIKPALGRIALDKLSPQQVQQFMNEKLASGLSPRTVEYLHDILQSGLGKAVKWGAVPRNVAALTEAPRVPRFEIEPFTPAQAKVFLSAITGNRLEALYTVAMAVGLRQGEALGLRWCDVDLQANTLMVRMQLQRIEGKAQLVTPKTAHSRRTVALPNVVVTALHRHRGVQLTERIKAGNRWQNLDLVFATAHGTPLDASSVTRSFKATVQRAGLPKQRFHDLRHCCASLLLAQGVHPRVVMETLGHSTIGLTMNVYSHVIPALQREAAHSMDMILATGG